MPTTAQSTALGPDAKVQINGTIYTTISGRYRFTGDVPDTSDSTSGPGKTNKAGLGELEVTFVGHQDINVNPHAPAGFNLTFGVLVNLALDVFGDNRTLVYTSPAFRITEVSGDFQVQGSQPQTISFSGRSWGLAFANGILED